MRYQHRRRSEGRNNNAIGFRNAGEKASERNRTCDPHSSFAGLDAEIGNNIARNCVFLPNPTAPTLNPLAAVTCLPPLACNQSRVTGLGWTK